MGFALIQYALVIVLVVFIVFFVWQIWCLFALNLVNPVLVGLKAPAVSTQQCGHTTDYLNQLTRSVKQIHVPKTPSFDIAITPGMVQILVGITFIALVVLLLAALLNVLDKLKLDLNKVLDDIIHVIAGLGLGKWLFKPGTSAAKSHYKRRPGQGSNLIFISYRKADSADVVSHIAEKLTAYFGDELVFKDNLSIHPGTNFDRTINAALHTCRVLLAVIGDQWLAIDEKTGQCRLEDGADYVRLEIATGLQRGICVIPLIVRNAKFPKAADLPSVLAALPLQQGLPIRPDPDFHHDMSRLIHAIESVLDR